MGKAAQGQRRRAELPDVLSVQLDSLFLQEALLLSLPLKQGSFLLLSEHVLTCSRLSTTLLPAFSCLPHVDVEIQEHSWGFWVSEGFRGLGSQVPESLVTLNKKQDYTGPRLPSSQEAKSPPRICAAPDAPNNLTLSVVIRGCYLFGLGKLEYAPSSLRFPTFSSLLAVVGQASLRFAI